MNYIYNPVLQGSIAGGLTEYFFISTDGQIDGIDPTKTTKMVPKLIMEKVLTSVVIAIPLYYIVNMDGVPSVVKANPLISGAAATFLLFYSGYTWALENAAMSIVGIFMR